MQHETNVAAEGWQLAGNSAEAYERYLASAFAPWARALVGAAGAQAGSRVLDVACGTGIVARQAASVVGPSGTVTGVDLNPDMLRVAGTTSAGIRPAITYRQGNATDLPFSAASFDAACCEQGLQFFSDPAAALREMHRVLTPGGRAAVSVCRPIRYCPAYVIMADALERHVGKEAGAMMRSPFSSWSVDEIRGLFRSAGFVDVHVHIEVASLRYPSISEFLRREAASSPLAGPVGALDRPRREGLVQELESALADRVDDDGIACGIEAYVVIARRAIS